MTEHTPYIDFEKLPTPSDGFLVTLFITVRSVAAEERFVPAWRNEGFNFRVSSPTELVRSVASLTSKDLPEFPGAGMKATEPQTNSESVSEITRSK